MKFSTTNTFSELTRDMKSMKFSVRCVKD